MKKIPLTQGKFAIVDDEDFDYLSRFTFCYGPNGHAVRRVMQTNGNSVSIGMIYFILHKEKFEVYHYKNGNTLDFRKENILITSRQNSSACLTTLRDHTSIYRGVCWDKQAKKWNATISKRIDGKRQKYHLGYFDTQEKAGLAYNKKAFEIYGEFAYQNKIEV
jgi:hypothetical protein